MHEGGSALRRDDKKNIQTSGLPASEHDQEGKVTNKQGFCTPMEGEHLHIDTLESNNLILEETDSTQEDKDSGVKLLYQEHSSSPEDAPNPEQRDLPDSNLSDLGAFASALSEKSEKVGIALPDESSELTSVQSLEICTEASEFADYGRDTDLDILPPAPMIEINGAVSGAVEAAHIKENDYEESNHQHDKCHIQASICNERTKSGREELHLFYEDTSISDHPEDLPVISAFTTETSLGVPISTRDSASKILPRNHSSSAGTGGDISVASHTGGFLHERKDSLKGRGSPRSDTRGLSFKKIHQKFDVSDTYKMKHSAASNMSSYNSLLRSGRLSECIELLEDMNKKDMLDMNKIYHAKFFDLCRRQKAVKEAFRFAKLILNPTLSTFNMLMSVCSSAQDSDGAFEVWQLAQVAGFKADCKLYTTLISTCAKSGKVDTMFEVFHDMVNRGIEPNVHTYGALIDGCARAGQVAKAFGAYGILRSKNVKPDRVVFNALITACGHSGAVERAFDVLAEMTSEAHPVDPDHVTIGALITACMSAGQVDRVKGVYEMIDTYNIKGSPELYTIAVNSCSHSGDWEFACKIYDDMKKKGVVPDEMFFSALIDVAGHAGNLDAAFEVLREARTQGMNPGIVSYSSLMGACSKTQNWEKALELFEQIKALGVNLTVSTVNALITALCDADQMQKALDVLSQMKKLGLCPNGVTYSILLVASEKNDDLVGLTLFSQAKADGVPFSFIMYKCLIRMCSRKFENASKIGEPVFSFKSGKPQIDSKWASLALMVYREVIGSGLTPSVEMLAQVLRCLQLPQDVVLKNRLTETLGINTEKSRSANLLSLIDGFGEYDPRAFSLFEEAASLGIAPCVSFKESPIFIDARSLGTHIAEVYILTVLKGLKHRLAAGARLPGITILLPVEMAEISCPKGDRTINISGRVNQAVGALLRRLRLPYQGGESHGKIRISGLVVRRWLQPKLVASINGKQAQLGLSQLGLASGITRQQRNIRTGNLSLY